MSSQSWLQGGQQRGKKSERFFAGGLFPELVAFAATTPSSRTFDRMVGIYRRSGENLRLLTNAPSVSIAAVVASLGTEKTPNKTM